MEPETVSIRDREAPYAHRCGTNLCSQRKSKNFPTVLPNRIPQTAYIQVEKYLFAVPTAITVNMSTHNLDFLEKHDWLGKPVNRVIVHWGGSGAAANV